MTEAIERMRPLYEAKMLGAYDHRAADVVKSPTATKRQNQPRYLDERDHMSATRPAIPFYWVDEGRISEGLNPWRLTFARITSPTNMRTFIATGIPNDGIGDSVFILESRDASALLANCNSFVFDYVARQKLAGLNMLFYIVKQLPFVNRTITLGPAPFQPELSVSDWLAPHVLELTYTAWDMEPFARDLGDTGGPFRWDPERRFLLRCELDAAFFHLYGVVRDDVDYIMDTFPIVKRKDEVAHGEYRTKGVILEIFDAMQTAIDTDVSYRTILDPAPGDGARHTSPRPSWASPPIQPA